VVRERCRVVGHTDRVNCVAWSPDGATLASGNFDHTIQLWDAKLGTSRAVLEGHRAAVFHAQSHVSFLSF
jgi:WD40 repeat protein